MARTDSTEARSIDLSIRPVLVGYADSASLIADVARDLGLSDLCHAANDIAAAIYTRHAALRKAVVEPSADEWDDALFVADDEVSRLGDRLYDETGGEWAGFPYSGFYVVAPASWWDSLEV